jgi:hypothetical protein
LVDTAKSNWLKNFNVEDWSVTNTTKTKGLTIEGLKVAEMLAFISKEKSIKENVDIALKPALNKVLS